MPPETVSLEGTGQLVVAWGSGGNVHGAHIPTGGAVGKTLRKFADAAATGLTDGYPYSPDADMEDSTHLTATRDDLLDTGLIEILEQGADLPAATEKDLTGRSLSCYALVVGSGDKQVSLIRKRTPIVLGSKALVARLVSGEISKVDEPVFAFDPTFDVIVTKTDVYILNKKAFDALFRDSEVVLAKTPEWVADLAAHLPIAADGIQRLEDALRRNQFHRNKFHTILQRPYIQTLTTDDLKLVMGKHGLDHDMLMPNGELAFDTPANTKHILNLLNEDLFAGDFSGAQYAAGSKRSLGK